MKYNNSSIDKTPFNYALRFLEDIADEMKLVRDMRRERNMIGWYHSLKSVYNMIHFKMMLDDKVADEIEKTLNERFDKLNKRLSNNNVPIKIQQFILNTAEIELDEIELLINDLLYEYDLKYPKSKSVTWQDEVRAGYE